MRPRPCYKAVTKIWLPFRSQGVLYRRIITFRQFFDNSLAHHSVPSKGVPRAPLLRATRPRGIAAVTDDRIQRQNLTPTRFSVSPIAPTRSDRGSQRNSQEEGLCRQKRVSRNNSAPRQNFPHLAPGQWPGAMAGGWIMLGRGPVLTTRRSRCSPWRLGRTGLRSGCCEAGLG